jgi:hypothetical protein
MDDTIFNFIDSVLFNKKKLNTINEGETQFNLYMVNRWCSMYSSDVAQIINETSNKYGKLFQTKQEQYEFVLNMLPRVKKKRINYIKKTKEEPKKEDTDLVLLAKAMETSKREVEENLKMLEELGLND